MILLGHVVILLLCLLGSAFFSGIETGIVSIHRLRLRHFVRENKAGARGLQEFLDAPDRLLGTTLVGNNLFNVMLSVITVSYAAQLGGVWGQAVGSAAMTLLVLVFGEYVPKAWFQSRPLDRSRRFVGLLQIAEVVFRPVAVILVGITRWVLPSAGAGTPPAPVVTKEDLKVLAREGEREGLFTSAKRFMIHRVFELSSKRAHQVMVPREAMTVVATDASVPALIELARSSGFTRLPAYDSAKGEFVGIVNVFYVLSAPREDAPKTVAGYVRPPLFVAADMPVDDILPRMRRMRQPMCLVKAADGEVAGLVTVDDILEEIVGTL